MTLCEELYFDITLMGPKSEIKKFVSFLRSGELDDFFEVEDELFSFDDDYDTAQPDAHVSVMFATDEFGVEVDEFDTDEFLELICKAAKPLYMSGSFYNFDDEEYRFISEVGDSYYANADSARVFNDELDEERAREELEASEDDED